MLMRCTAPFSLWITRCSSWFGHSLWLPALLATAPLVPQMFIIYIRNPSTGDLCGPLLLNKIYKSHFSGLEDSGAPKWHILGKTRKSHHACADTRKDTGEIPLPAIGGSQLLYSTLSVHVLGAESPFPGELIRFGSESAGPCLPSLCGLHCRLL